MSGRARRHASADAAAVDDNYGFAALGELIGGRDAGNARADDGDTRNSLRWTCLRWRYPPRASTDERLSSIPFGSIICLSPRRPCNYLSAFGIVSAATASAYAVADGSDAGATNPLIAS